MKIVQYPDIHRHIQSGDVIAFAGDDPFSEVVRISTQSAVSHVGVAWVSDQVPEKTSDDPAESLVKIDIIESHPLCFDSETGKPKMGVQRNPLEALIDTYQGQIWWLPLSPAKRCHFNLQAFTDFMLESEKRAYDFVQAALAGLDLLDDMGLTRAREDESSFFCSELIAAAFKRAGLINDVNPSEVTPIDLCRFAIYDDNYYLLRGQAVKIEGYNSRSDMKI